MGCVLTCHSTLSPCIITVPQIWLNVRNEQYLPNTETGFPPFDILFQSSSSRKMDFMTWLHVCNALPGCRKGSINHNFRMLRWIHHFKSSACKCVRLHVHVCIHVTYCIEKILWNRNFHNPTENYSKLLFIAIKNITTTALSVNSHDLL